MATHFSLDQIREAAEAEFGSTNLALSEKLGDEVVLLNPLRLPEKRRRALTALQGEATDKGINEDGTTEDDGEDFGEAAEVFAKALHIAAEDTVELGQGTYHSDLAQRFIDEVAAGDLAILAAVFKLYTKGTQMGEA